MQDEKPPMKKLPTSRLPEETAPRPEFPEQEQTPPGLDAEMEPSPDHGETSYTGSGRLAGHPAKHRREMRLARIAQRIGYISNGPLHI